MDKTPDKSFTIKEIAALCHVSRGTVDRVLNDRGHVKEETKKIVLETLQNMGYQKNLVGKALTLKRTAPTIRVILCSQGNPFFDPVIEGIEQSALQLKDWGVTLQMHLIKGHDEQKELSLLQNVDDIDALIIQPINHPFIKERLKNLVQSNLPVITINTDIEKECRTLYVGSDYYQGGKIAAGLFRLILQSKAQIAILKGVPTLSGHTLRFQGFKDYLNKNIDIIFEKDIQDDKEKAYSETLRLLQMHPHIDGIFVVAACASDVCSVLVEKNRANIPVICFDTVPSTVKMMEKGIVRAAICQNPYEQGFQSVKAAFDQILHNSHQNTEDILLSNAIIIKENLF